MAWNPMLRRSLPNLPTLSAAGFAVLRHLWSSWVTALLRAVLDGAVISEEAWRPEVDSSPRRNTIKQRSVLTLYTRPKGGG
jgi:hypothetical protein